MVCLFCFQAKGKTNVTSEVRASDRFSWSEHRKLSWEDFKGPSDGGSHESAAATCCSIGFKIDNTGTGDRKVTVYNTFYIDRSWVKEDARIGSILAHEQGHFDLCELYTRKLRERTAAIDVNAKDLKQQLMDIYAAVNDEYEARQQAYEYETTHGTDLPAQNRWERMIQRELTEAPQSI
ncbi:hypothetical protein GCM10023093_14840 [Nemorincola caseinilytica]|uniref:DUF922 domain-containing protein n=2 Tax=Nemorincola caseinilytica TaxID=2054315 RepID=A0ABP8NE78_9BACT